MKDICTIEFDVELEPVAGNSILFVMAAEAEYGASLRSRIKPLLTGVGPVEAAVAVTRALTWLDDNADLPTLVVSLGSAGSSRLEQTKVYQVTSVTYGEILASPFCFDIDLPLHIPGIPEATLSTGGNVISGKGYANVPSDMVDMETYAVLRACQYYNLPLIGLRGISDGAEELRHISDRTEYLKIIDHKLASTLDIVLTALATGDSLNRS